MPFEPPLYPTNAFRFLGDPTFPSYPVPKHDAKGHQDLPESISSPAWVQSSLPAKCPLQIHIVGAGIAGLTAAISLTLSGHKVVIFERAPVFGEVGAGIQVPPNSTRYLLAWGVGPHIEPHISEPEAIQLRRYHDGEVVGMTRIRSSTGKIGFREKFGAPYFVVHRADYHSALVARCKELNIDIRTDSEVVGYDFHNTTPPVHYDTTNASTPTTNGTSHPQTSKAVTLHLKAGTSHPADLIIAADGLNSINRTTILHSHNLPDVTPQSTSQAAYRATLPLSHLATNPKTAWLTSTPNQNLWMGPSRHVMLYPIGGGGNNNDNSTNTSNRLLNIVFSHPESKPRHTWPTDPATVRTDLKSQFANWDPNLLAVIDRLCDSPDGRIVKWPIMTVPPLPTWTHASGRLIVIGDSAHSMVPYMSQGAAIAVEDAAAISAALACVEDPDEIGAALAVFETVRKERTEGMQQASWLNGEIWHIEDRTLQEARNEGMRGSLEGDAERKETEWSAVQWSDPACQAWTYGYDSVAEVMSAWERTRKQKS